MICEQTFQLVGQLIINVLIYCANRAKPVGRILMLDVKPRCRCFYDKKKITKRKADTRSKVDMGWLVRLDHDKNNNYCKINCSQIENQTIRQLAPDTCKWNKTDKLNIAPALKPTSICVAVPRKIFAAAKHDLFNRQRVDIAAAGIAYWLPT